MFPLRLLAAGSTALFAFAALADPNVLTYHNDDSRTGANLSETILTPANVNSTNFGKLFSYNVDGYLYAQPLYVSELSIPGRGSHDVVFAATEHNTVYALDADSNAGTNGGVLWLQNLGPSAPCPAANFEFEAIEPEVGITGTPVIDLASKTLYVDAFLEDTNGVFSHQLHALNITNGMERAGSPVTIEISIPGVGVGSTNGVLTFQPRQQLQRSALTLAGGILYLAYAGYTDMPDTDPFHGWILGFNPTTLQLLTNYVFNSTPNGTVKTFGASAGEGGIWMGGGGLSVDANTNLYFSTGDGNFTAYSGGTDYGDSVIKLSTHEGLSVLDYFTSFNQSFYQQNDLDVGSGGVMLLPDQPGPCPHLLVAAGKPQYAYLLDRDMFTMDGNHYDATNDWDNILQTMPLGGGSYCTPAYYNEQVYYGAWDDTIRGYVVSNGTLIPDLPGTYGSRTYPFPGATPSISANGTNNGILWAIQNDNPAVLVAYNATNLSTELYNSSQASTRDQLTNGVKFAVPTVANGKVYVGGQYSLAVFGLLSNSQDPYSLWKAEHFGTNANDPGIAGNLADPDGDGIPNILEYALGSDPLVPNTNAPISGTIVSNHFQLEFNRNTCATNLTYALQAASALDGSWSNLVTYPAGACWCTNTPQSIVSESAATGSPPDQSVCVTITDPVDCTSSGATNRFFRLQVELQ